MNTTQALSAARIVLEKITSNEFIDENEFLREFGITDAQAVNALPIIKALEIVEGARP